MTAANTAIDIANISLVSPECSVLRLRAGTIDVFDQQVQRLAVVLGVAMEKYDGIGLAAPQIGWPIRMIALKRLVTGRTEVWCNPEIVMQQGEQTTSEGCLSLPGETATKKRSFIVSVRAQDTKGTWQHFVRKGLEAACVQHEIDHLNGILMID